MESIEVVVVAEAGELFKETSIKDINEYAVGSYRFWLQKSGSLALKLDGGRQLYTIPKGSKLYDRLKADLFEFTKGRDNEYALGYYRFWLSVSKQLAVKLDGKDPLYSIPKETPLYNRIMSDYFPNS